MPNVEIHGVADPKARELRDRVFDLFSQASFVEEMVVTIFATAVTDRRGSCQPFIRLVNSDPGLNLEIVPGLKKLGLDIEVLALVAFHPKNS